MPAKSKAQQVVMGMALAARRGEMKVSELSDAALKIYKSDMTDKQIEDFASTPRKDLPKHKMKSLKESILSSTNVGRKGIIFGWLKDYFTYCTTYDGKSLNDLVVLGKDNKIYLKPHYGQCADGKQHVLGCATIKYKGEELPDYIQFAECDVWSFELYCPNMKSTKGWPEVVTGQLVYGMTAVTDFEIKEYNKNSKIGKLNKYIDLQ